MGVKKILIVDDEPFILKLYTIILGNAGYEIDNAINGYKALEKLESTIYNLVLLDIMMPELDGLKTLEIIKNNDSYLNLKIIMLSALSGENSVQKFKKLADGYIVKSELEPRDLVNIVNSYLMNSE